MTCFCLTVRCLVGATMAQLLSSDFTLSPPAEAVCWWTHRAITTQVRNSEWERRSLSLRGSMTEPQEILQRRLTSFSRLLLSTPSVASSVRAEIPPTTHLHTAQAVHKHGLTAS
ncbi:hypothetical protein GOODEAATRI_002334 [Goodea atripinnis]|uniref:Secreted protein n=1 Tax=Goodea atripinnis TaxID=208336 RepID=A0ABV0P0W9_9TELE